MEGTGNRGARAGASTAPASAPPGQKQGYGPKAGQALSRQQLQGVKSSCQLHPKPTWCTAAHQGSSALCGHTPGQCWAGMCCAKTWLHHWGAKGGEELPTAPNLQPQ